MLATIGYEKADLNDFLATLIAGEVEMLVDVRDRAQSRRPGFSKASLASALGDIGVEYLHLKELGDPKEGRDAARRGEYQLFREIFRGVMRTEAAQKAISTLHDLAAQRRICLMCFERDHRHCHRKIVSDQLEVMLACKTDHLGVNKSVRGRAKGGRGLYFDQSAAASV